MVRWCADAVAGPLLMIDRGEAVACDDQGTPVFKLLIRNRRAASAQLYAFDLSNSTVADREAQRCAHATWRGRTRHRPLHLCAVAKALSTSHSAKAQEWTSVFLLNAVDGCFRSCNRLNAGDRRRAAVA